MRFNIQLYSDGIPSKYGNCYDLTLEDSVEELIYYDEFSERYSKESLKKYLIDLKPGYVILGSQWSETKITKK